MSANPPKEEFSVLERAGLAGWRAPLPPAGFAERVVARAAAETESAASPPGRLAVAAMALLVLGSVLSVRTMLDGPAGAPTHDLPGGLGGYDAGPRPEVHTDGHQHRNNDGYGDRHDDGHDDVRGRGDVQPQAQENAPDPQPGQPAQLAQLDDVGAALDGGRKHPS